jgi:predicted transcriptional regulator
MQKEEIEITIRPDGQIEYTIKGVKGAACDTISTLLEQLGKIQAERHTGEYYEQEGDAHLNLGHQ